MSTVHFSIYQKPMQMCRRIIRLSVLTLAVLILMSCGKESVKPGGPGEREFELYIDYWNPDGDNPQIRFDAENSSPEVRIDFSKTFAGVPMPPNRTNVIIENVRIIDDDNLNYHINEIRAYEWREDINDWKIDVEFIMEYDQVHDLAVVLVLDASSSLGADFTKVKAYANDFIVKMIAEIPTAQIGIVDFSDVINSFGLTNNVTALSSYIESIEQGPFTTLYEAMGVGIEKLHMSNAESKALLTFTDGTDNNSDPAYTPSWIVEQLNGDPSGISISSFAIGLEGKGGVDRPVLEQVAAGNGAVAFPRSVDELGVVFEKFSHSISTVYNLTYIRNQQVIPASNPAKLRFVLRSSPKKQ